jgi:DNA processing protein
MAANFPRRNRLISGFARGVLVVEAAPQSGSLITARLAAEQGREVFAIPGSIHSPQARGCHALIKQGAKLVETAQDVLEELRWPVAEPAIAPPAAHDRPDEVPADEHARILDALGHDPCAVDTLVERSGLTAEALSVMLLHLELDGRVASLPGGRYQRLSGA